MPNIFLPQQNLRQSRSPENRFCVSFAKYYEMNYARIHNGTSKKNTLFLREMPVSECGIADLVVASWNVEGKAEDSLLFRAFELKMSDWQGGLSQAFRYKCYANAAILVMPNNKATAARKAENTFRTLGVGLWGFDDVNFVLHQYYTPRPTNPMDKDKHNKVIKRIPRYYGVAINSLYLSIDCSSSSR
jgi:hypothetical protein